MAEAPLVAVLILNWRLPRATLQCFADLMACGYPRLAVLIMDNGSGDGSAELFQREAAAAEVLAFPQNLGYCAATNRGLAWAQARGAELVLLLNNDVRVAPGFLDPLVTAMRNDPDIAGVGPTILRPDGKVWCQGARVAFRPNLSQLLAQGQAPAPRTRGPAAVGYIPGACALYRLADLLALGGLDEGYFMYFEDADLGERLRERGKKILWLPWSAVTHDASASSGGGRSPMRKYMMAVNAARFLRAHGTPALWLAFLLFDVLGWPLAVLGGTSPRAAYAKGRGALAGLLGKDVGVQDVARGRS